MPGRTDYSSDNDGDMVTQQPNRLILCFDGTGNAFQGTPGDTNIVKLYGMFDRSDGNQMHYYQPGIGTYPAEGPVNVNWFRAFMRKLEALVDKGFATSFDSHVIAGYKFIMRYYKPGDRIYVFGFSRGAYTARFLARMIAHIGLLSMGNEELVPFAYKVYQDYEQGLCKGDAGKELTLMNSFKKHFCRTEARGQNSSSDESGIKVHFLGLFDCVSSVRNLDIPFFQKTAPPLPAAEGTAKYVRHAVAIDERRVKFRAALFSQEVKDEAKISKSNPEDIKEVWFPGNHGDIGGGWSKDEADMTEAEKKKFKDGASATTAGDYFQLSDIALKWMVDELDSVERLHTKDPSNRIRWSGEKDSFLTRFEQHKKQGSIIDARMHDTMRLGGGCSLLKVALWNFMEYIPFFIKRWEYDPDPNRKGEYRWNYRGFPANCGGTRDIPSSALFHHSAILRMRLKPSTEKRDHRSKCYVPSNDVYVATGKVSPISNKRFLKELAVRESPEPSGDRRPLIDNKPAIKFQHDSHSDFDCVPCGATDKWDHIYRVVEA